MGEIASYGGRGTGRLGFVVSQVPKSGGPGAPGFSFRLKSKLDVWMRSFNETQIMTKEKFVRCALYIENDPVRRGLALAPEMYPFSSAVGGPFDAMPLHLAGT